MVSPAFLRAYLICSDRARRSTGGRDGWPAFRLVRPECLSEPSPSHRRTEHSRGRYQADRFRANNRDKNPRLPAGEDRSPMSLIFSNCFKKSEMSPRSCVRGTRNSCSRASVISSRDRPSLSMPQIRDPIGLRLKQRPCSMSSNTAPS